MNLKKIPKDNTPLRFRFGENWSKFLSTINDDRIDQAKRSLIEMLGIEDLQGQAFLDIGCGSGLFSLAARLLGAKVFSFDYDRASVDCAQVLKNKYSPDDPLWTIQAGSVLDLPYLEQLGKFDIVYSWGVLHHTGAMWQAFDNITRSVTDDGRLFISIYNDQGRASLSWHRIKRMYNRLPRALHFLLFIPVFIRLWGPTTLKDLLRLRPFSTWRNYRLNRGMSPIYDVIDWIGGFPFEYAKPEKVFDFFHARGFILAKLTTCGGGHGCNEFVFVAPRQGKAGVKK
jgi:2-polyprenyl-3-methyl-5-hydroxy-6-metoxy-1,4-benzoquinol methylase